MKTMKAWSRWQDWVNVVLGLWLFFSPWLLGVSGVESAARSGWILGVLIVAASLWALASPRSTYSEWCNSVLGLAALVAPWVVGFTDLGITVWSFFVSGLIVLVLSVWTLLQLSGGEPKRAA